MQNIRPSIMLRGVRPSSRAGQETADDAWVVEERRLEAKRAKRGAFETEFRLTHATHDVTSDERRGRIEALRSSHNLLHDARERRKQQEQALDQAFAKTQAQVAAQNAAAEDARERQKKLAAMEASRMNRDIAEARRAAKVVNRKVEVETDNQMIKETLAAKRTFLY